jgi:HSP20 family protein
MELTPRRPLGEIGRLRREMDDLWRRFFGTSGLEMTVSEWMPSVDVSESEESFVVKAELPGLEAKDVDIDVSGDLLTIKGEKKTEQERKEENFHSRERYFGSFQRAIRLPAAVKTDEVDAVFKNGILTVTLPKAEESRRKKIEVKTH